MLRQLDDNLVVWAILRMCVNLILVISRPQGFGSKEEEEEEVSLRIEKVIKKVRINRKSHSYFARALCT